MMNIKKLLTKLLNNIVVIDRGNGQAPSVSANSYLDISITFNKTFDSAPSVFTEIESSSTSADLGKFTMSAINVTTTGFTIRVFNGATSTRTPAYRWLAIKEVRGVLRKSIFNTFTPYRKVVGAC